MKRVMMTTFVTMLLVGVVAAEDDITVNINNTFANAFVSGVGINWVNGPVMMTDVGATITRGDSAFTGTYWQVLNLDDSIGYDNPLDSRGDVTERDFIFDYTYSGIEAADVSFGYVYYDFVKLTGTGSNTEDVYTAIALKGVPLNPRAQVSYDIDGANSGVYGTLGISHSVNVTEEHAVGLWAKAVWTGGPYGAAYFSSDGSSDSGFQAYGVGANTSIPIDDSVGITFGLTYWAQADRDGVVGMTHSAWEAAGFESKADTLVASATFNIMLK